VGRAVVPPERRPDPTPDLVRRHVGAEQDGIIPFPSLAPHPLLLARAMWAAQWPSLGLETAGNPVSKELDFPFGPGVPRRRRHSPGLIAPGNPVEDVVTVGLHLLVGREVERTAHVTDVLIREERTTVRGVRWSLTHDSPRSSDRDGMPPKPQRSAKPDPPASNMRVSPAA